MGDETDVKSSFKDKFFLICTGRRTLSISEDPDNLISGVDSTCSWGQVVLTGNTCPEPQEPSTDLLGARILNTRGDT